MTTTKLGLTKGVAGEHGTEHVLLFATGDANKLTVKSWKEVRVGFRADGHSRQAPLEGMAPVWSLSDFDAALANGWRGRTEKVEAFRKAVVAGQKYSVIAEIEACG